MDDTGEHLLDAALAEYAALRGEIDRRSRAQQTLATLAVTLTGALVAYAIDKDAAAILLIQPIVVCAFGLLYADHGAAIRRLGRYLDRSVGATVVRVTGDRRAMRWEALAARREGLWRLFWLAPPVLIFVGSSAAVLAVSLTARLSPAVAGGSTLLHLPAWVFLVTWLVGIVLVLAAALAFWAAFWPPLSGFDEVVEAAEWKDGRLDLPTG